MILPAPQSQPSQDAALVTKAFFRAAERLALARRDIAHVLGLSEATLSRLTTKGDSLSLNTKEGEIALLFLRIFRSLDAYVGGNEDSARQWFAAGNAYLRTSPKEAIKTLEGIVDVARYLDAMRGKV